MVLAILNKGRIIQTKGGKGEGSGKIPNYSFNQNTDNQQALKREVIDPGLELMKGLSTEGIGY